MAPMWGLGGAAIRQNLALWSAVVRPNLLFSPLLLALATSPAWAGEADCRFEAGTLTVPAEVAGVAGDYILDTGAAQTTLHETKAQAEGFAATALSGDVRLAGMVVRGAALKVA